MAARWYAELNVEELLQGALPLDGDNCDVPRLMDDLNVQTGGRTFNKRWAAMLGYAQEEIDSSVSARQVLVHPDDLPGVEEAMRAHLENETDFYESVSDSYRPHRSRP